MERLDIPPGAVVGWEAGYFHLEGFSEYGQAYDRRAQAEISALVLSHV